MTPETAWLNERYRIGAPLGSEANSCVFAARDMEQGREVAIKFLVAATIEASRFDLEMGKLKSLSHANIVEVYDAGTITANAPQRPEFLPKAKGETIPFVVTELLLGGELTRKLPRRLSDILKLGSELAGALDYAHSKGIFHLDIKPSNIRRKESGRPALLDFGYIGCHSPRFHSQPEEPHSRYWSPEQRSGYEGSAAADIFSLGAVLLELYTGTPPAADGSLPWEELGLRLEQEIGSNSLALLIRESFTRICATQPNERLHDAATMAIELERLLARLPKENTTQPPTRTHFGRYELVRLLAVGGMGEIYEAVLRGAADFEKRCVIKKILPHLANEEEFVSKFIDEAKLVVQLTHGNIVPVFDMGEQEGEFYLAMEYVEGRDLRSLLRELKQRGQQLDPDLALFIIAEVCRGLGYAHRKTDAQGSSLGIIHRDISPSNIMVSRDGEVKIVDFGIAKAASKSTRSITGRLQGKFGYMSPEQACGGELDQRSDLFSTGVVLYEMLTGRRPFDGNSDLETLERVKQLKVTPASDHRPELSSQLDQLLTKALAKEPADRFQSADELQRELVAIADSMKTASDLAATLSQIFPTGTPAATPKVSFGELLELQADFAPVGGGTATATILPTPITGEERTETLANSQSQSSAPLASKANSDSFESSEASPTTATQPDRPGLLSAPPTKKARDEDSPEQPKRHRWGLLLLALLLLTSGGWFTWHKLNSSPLEDQAPQAEPVTPEPDINQEQGDAIQADLKPQPPASADRWHPIVFELDPVATQLRVGPSDRWRLPESAGGPRLLKTSGPVDIQASLEGYQDCSFSLDASRLEQLELPPVAGASNCDVDLWGSPGEGGQLTATITLTPIPQVATLEDIAEEADLAEETIQKSKTTSPTNATTKHVKRTSSSR